MIGLFGGAFDPPHLGHLMAAVYAVTMDERIDRVLMVPTAYHPWKPNLKTPLKDRVAMLDLLLDLLGYERPFLRIGVDDEIEADLLKKYPDMPVYTIDVIEEYIDRDKQVVLVIGQDEAEDLPRWHRHEDVLRLAGPPCIVPRGSLKSVHCDISSTVIRDLLVRGHFDEAEAFVPKPILDYIEAHRLYMPTKWARTRRG